jgi:6-phospho-3-hexuloisomerase
MSIIPAEGEQSPMDRMREICCGYQEYQAACCSSLGQQQPAIQKLVDWMEHAGAIHIYGFGRSGTAALAFAIRLRHFGKYLPPAWWVGDQVREPIGRDDLVILFTREGNRKEIVAVAEKARDLHARIAAVTALESTHLPIPHDLVIRLPPSERDFVYGGGDFELAAFVFQEILVTYIGCEKRIPKHEVNTKHI